MACKKPIIATNIESLKGFGKSIYMIPDNNPKNIVNAVNKVFSNKKLLKKLEDNAYKKSKELTWTKKSKKVSSVIKKVVK